MKEGPPLPEDRSLLQRFARYYRDRPVSSLSEQSVYSNVSNFFRTSSTINTVIQKVSNMITVHEASAPYSLFVKTLKGVKEELERFRQTGIFPGQESPPAEILQESMSTIDPTPNYSDADWESHVNTNPLNQE